MSFSNNFSIQNFYMPAQTHTVAGAISATGGTVIINNAANIAMTLTPENNQLYFFYCLNTSDGTTVTLGGSFTWDGTNEIATFDADNEAVVVHFVGGRAYVLSNPGTVAFSTAG